MLRGVVQPFLEFTRTHDIKCVLDLASGSGVPVELLIQECLAKGETPPKFILTDLYPRPEIWEPLRLKYPTFIDYIAKPVDATQVDSALVARSDARLIVNAFTISRHRWQRVWRDAIVSEVPMMVVEPFARDPRAFWRYFPVGLPALLANPL